MVRAGAGEPGRVGASWASLLPTLPEHPKVLVGLRQFSALFAFSPSQYQQVAKQGVRGLHPLRMLVGFGGTLLHQKCHRKLKARGGKPQALLCPAWWWSLYSQIWFPSSKLSPPIEAWSLHPSRVPLSKPCPSMQARYPLVQAWSPI